MSYFDDEDEYNKSNSSGSGSDDDDESQSDATLAAEEIDGDDEERDEDDVDENVVVEEEEDDDVSIDDEELLNDMLNDKDDDDDDDDEDHDIHTKGKVKEKGKDKGDQDDRLMFGGYDSDNDDDDKSTTMNMEDMDSMEDDDDDDEDMDGSMYLQKFNQELNSQYMLSMHPECTTHNYEEIHAMTQVVRNEDGIIVDELHQTIPFLTKYEKARILGQRAKQIDSGARAFVKHSEDIIDGYLIAEMELKEKKIPFIIRRPLPNGGSEYWSIKDLEIIS